MGGGCSSGIGTMPTSRTVYAMRHAQNEFGLDDPNLTDRGRKQVAEEIKNYFSGVNFDIIRCGSYLRHLKSVEIARHILQDFRLYNFRTHLLSLANEMDETANQCVVQLRQHPKGPEVGFRVDTWIEADPILMDNCKKQFENFLREIPPTERIILAISSSPIIESAVLHPEKTWLLGECGIIRYTIDADGTILSSEVIFEGFFEKPPQKSE